jgi:hypothetical protein
VDDHFFARHPELKYDTTQDGYVVPIDKSTLDKAPRFQGLRAA